MRTAFHPAHIRQGIRQTCIKKVTTFLLWFRTLQVVVGPLLKITAQSQSQSTESSMAWQTGNRGHKVVAFWQQLCSLSHIRIGQGAFHTSAMPDASMHTRENRGQSCCLEICDAHHCKRSRCTGANGPTFLIRPNFLLWNVFCRVLSSGIRSILTLAGGMLRVGKNPLSFYWISPS